MQEFAETMAGVDAILHPNTAGNLLGIGNCCGNPALLIPVGFLDQPTRQGFTEYVPPEKRPSGAALHKVPFAVTLTGRLFDEALLIAIGRNLSETIGLGPLKPPA